MRRRTVAAALWPMAAAAMPPLRFLGLAPHDRFGHYARDLLEQALAATGLGVGLRALPRQDLSQGRILLELSSGRLDVIWSMTSVERERTLLPVRVPIDRGLLGWRLLLVRRREAAIWGEPLTLSALRQRTGGLGAHWPDVEILRANGLKIEAVHRAGNLLAMLQQGRVDYYPRSALEVQDELRLPAGASLTMARGGWLRYPAASYFFLRPGMERLAEALQQVLNDMVGSGALQRLFEARMGPVLEGLPLSAARMLTLENPLLPASVPLAQAAYWQQPPR